MALSLGLFPSESGVTIEASSEGHRQFLCAADRVVPDRVSGLGCKGNSGP